MNGWSPMSPMSPMSQFSQQSETVPIHRFEQLVGTKTQTDQSQWGVINRHLNPLHPFGASTRSAPEPESISKTTVGRNTTTQLTPDSLFNVAHPPSHPTEASYLYEHNMNKKQPSFDGNTYITLDTCSRNWETECPYQFRIRFGDQSPSDRGIHVPFRLVSVAAVVFSDIRIPARCLWESNVGTHLILRIKELQQENQFYSNPNMNRTTDLLLDVGRQDGEFVHLRCSNSVEWTYNRPTFTIWTCQFLRTDGTPLVSRSDRTDPEHPETWAIVTRRDPDHWFLDRYNKEPWYDDLGLCQTQITDAISRWQTLGEEERSVVRPMIHRFKKAYKKVRLQEVDPKQGANNTHISIRVISELSRPIQTIQQQGH